MPLSRLRLRLAAWFALTFVIGLTLVNLALTAYLLNESNQRLNAGLREEALALIDFVDTEFRESPAAGLAMAAREALAEWPEHHAAFAIYDVTGVLLGSRGDSTQLRALPTTLSSTDTAVSEIDGEGPHSWRQVTVAEPDGPPIRIRASTSTRPIDQEAAALVTWLVLSIPIVLAISLVGGYILSRRALTPIQGLERAVAAIAPETLDERLPVGEVRDEIDHLAVQFNGLLERLQHAQEQNRRFVQHAAHQIRTPLTLVLGEADLSLERPRTAGEREEALQRIRTAAGQMRRRVDELLILARAEAGERPALNQTIELDGLAFDCADLMRGRAQQFGQRLELHRVEPVVVTGNEGLLKEATMELLENACRHGSPACPIGIATFAEGSSALLTVTSQAQRVEEEPVTSPDGPTENHGIGLTVVRWIASEHGGKLAHAQVGDVSVYKLYLPLVHQEETLPEASQSSTVPA